MAQDDHAAAMNRMRRNILEVAAAANEGHVPSALSILDVIWVLYDYVLPYRSRNGHNRDRFVLSKGHGSLALYETLASKGLLDASELESFCSYDSLLGGHPDRTKVPGVEASTGSLGHGLPLAVGMALGEKIQGSDG